VAIKFISNASDQQISFMTPITMVKILHFVNFLYLVNLVFRLHVVD